MKCYDFPELAQPLLLFKKLTGNIIGNQLNYRKSKAKTELSTSQRNKDNENFKVAMYRRD